jgi:hypothetical protein
VTLRGHGCQSAQWPPLRYSKPRNGSSLSRAYALTSVRIVTPSCLRLSQCTGLRRQHAADHGEGALVL